MHAVYEFIKLFESLSTAFRRPMRYKPKEAGNVYRLIDAAPIEHFFNDSFLFYNQNFGQM